jgi:hypothetical protein
MNLPSVGFSIADAEFAVREMKKREKITQSNR